MSGAHTVGDVGRFEGLLRTWARNGLQAVLSVKPEGANGALLRSILPTGTLVGRITNSTTLTDSAIQQAYEADPKAAAAWIVGVCLPTMNAQPQFNAWQFNNEPVFGDGETRLFRIRRLCEFMREVIDLANGHGHGVALFNFARGTPEPHEWIHFHEVWRYALTKNRTLPAGRKNIMCLHQYGSFNKAGPGSLFHEEAWHAKRFETQIRPNLPPDLQAAEYLPNEAGPDGGQPNLKGWKEVYGQNDAGRRALVNDWRVYNEWLAQQAGCLGACFFTLGQEGGFDSFNIENDPVAQMLATTHYPQMKPATTQPTGGVVQVVNKPSNHWSERGGQPTRYGVVHSTVTPRNGSFESTATFLKQNTRGVSIHELVGSNKVYVMVPDAKAAHHCESDSVRLPGGEPSIFANELTWGIEGCQVDGSPMAPDVQENLFQRVLLAAHRLNIPSHRWVGHGEIDPTRRSDPVGIDMVQFRTRLAQELGETPQPQDPDYTKQDAGTGAWYLEWFSRAMRQDPGAKETLIRAIQAEPKREGVHNVMVEVALPPLYRERDKVSA